MSEAPTPSGVDEQKALDTSPAPENQSAAEKEQQATATEYSQTGGNQKTMHVKVYSPFRDYYDGQAFAISAENLTGPFDILPQHHNFISILNPCELVIRTVEDAHEPPVRIRISGGIMHVKADEVLVFLDV